MDRAPDDAVMFVCDCPHCGRRELRGPRSLRPIELDGGRAAWATTCRGCDGVVVVAAGREPLAVSEPALPPAPAAA